MIPHEGELLELNQSATYDPAEEDGTVSTIVLGGIRVSVYVDINGVFRVSVATDEDAVSELIHRGRGEEGAIDMSIDVNDIRVFHA